MVAIALLVAGVTGVGGTTPVADAGLSACWVQSYGYSGARGGCNSTSASSSTVRYAARVYCKNPSGAKFWRYGTWYYSPGHTSYAACASNEIRLNWGLAQSTW
jgi:hypothetical protein